MGTHQMMNVDDRRPRRVPSAHAIPGVQVEQGVEEAPGSYEGERRVVITIKLILV